jgi:hypothetical protein
MDCPRGCPGRPDLDPTQLVIDWFGDLICPMCGYTRYKEGDDEDFLDNNDDSLCDSRGECRSESKD